MGPEPLPFIGAHAEVGDTQDSGDLADRMSVGGAETRMGVQNAKGRARRPALSNR
jgi:hypothetical protein